MYRAKIRPGPHHPTPIEQHQRAGQGQVPQRLVQEGGLEGGVLHVARPDGAARLISQAPGQLGGSAEQLLVEPVAPATDGLGHGHARRHRVEPDRQVDAAPVRHPHAHRHAGGDAARDAQAPVPDLVHARQVVGDVGLPVGDQVVDPGPDQPGRDGPDGDGPHVVGIAAPGRPAAGGDLDRGEHARGRCTARRSGTVPSGCWLGLGRKAVRFIDGRSRSGQGVGARWRTGPRSPAVTGGARPATAGSSCSAKNRAVTTLAASELGRPGAARRPRRARRGRPGPGGPSATRRPPARTCAGRAWRRPGRRGRRTGRGRAARRWSRPAPSTAWASPARIEARSSPRLGQRVVQRPHLVQEVLATTAPPRMGSLRPTRSMAWMPLVPS